MNSFKNQLATLVLCVFFLSGVAAANIPSNISPQQLAQFKRLSPTQQKALAKSMGVDLKAIQAQISSGNAEQIDDGDDNQIHSYPRGTVFDEFGNPISNVENLESEDNDALKAFGYDVFANAPHTFAPDINIAIPDHYVIGSGDVLSIQIFGKENESYEFTVDRDGNIVLPQLGPFSVAGLKFSEMKSYLAQTIKNKVLGVDVVITLSKLRSIRVFVLGEAFKPGPYILSALSSMTHALFSAGGINDIGSLRNIKLKRAGKLVNTLDLYDLLIHGDSSNDLLLKSGDVIFIEAVGERVSVDGEVRRPAVYELSEQETFQSVLNMAGGLLPSAYPSSTSVERFNNRNIRSMLNVDLTNSESLLKSVKDGDYIRVMKTSDVYDESITVIGAVSHPGRYQWQQGQRISDVLPNMYSHLLPDADLIYALVIRERNNTRLIDVLQFSLLSIMSDKSSDDNLELLPNDKVLIFDNTEGIKTTFSHLDNFALTSEELLEKEKLNAINSTEQDEFWLEYGKVGRVNSDENVLLAKNTSLIELSGGQYEEELEINQLSYFSRARLLQPVIEQLKRQSAYGEPIKLVEVVGAVKHPGIYPLPLNGNVAGLLNSAGGLSESAYLLNAELTRSEIINDLAVKVPQSINLQNAIEQKTAFPLQSRDRLNVLKIPAWQDNHVIELRGEFKFPGKYTIRRGDKLSDVIVRAGGYTDYAYKEASLFTREKLKLLEKQNLVKVAESLRMEIASKSLAQRDSSQMVDYQQAKLLLSDLTKVTPVGRLVVDLALLDTQSKGEVLLEDGDVLYVPTKQNSINVIGQVQVATSHVFKEGLSVEEYVRLSGGIKQQADDERIYVIKANGAVEVPKDEDWFAMAGEDQLAPGDTIVVPLDADYMDSITLWSTGTQIVYQAAVAIAAIAGL